MKINIKTDGLKIHTGLLRVFIDDKYQSIDECDIELDKSHADYWFAVSLRQTRSTKKLYLNVREQLSGIDPSSCADDANSIFIAILVIGSIDSSGTNIKYITTPALIPKFQGPL